MISKTVKLAAVALGVTFTLAATGTAAARFHLTSSFRTPGFHGHGPRHGHGHGTPRGCYSTPSRCYDRIWIPSHWVHTHHGRIYKGGYWKSVVVPCF